MKKRHGRLVVKLFLLSAWLYAVPTVHAVTVFAAASLKDVLGELGAEYAESAGLSVTFSFGASSMLARQIEYGAPADLFVSANVAWMNALERKGLLAPHTRTELTGNRLVIVAPKSMHTEQVAWSDQMAVAALLTSGRIAMALVDAVPAGIYGKTALQSAGLWAQVQRQVVQTDNVRLALALVSRGEVPMGIVYASDQRSANVSKLMEFPIEAHGPIVYPMALIAGSKNPAAAQAFQAFLMTQTAQNTLLRHGFSVPDRR